MMDWATLVVDCLCVYSITLLLTTAYAFGWLRELIRRARTSFTRIDYTFESCRMCVGFWVALFWVMFWHGVDPTAILATYGASYFLATQER